MNYEKTVANLYKYLFEKVYNQYPLLEENSKLQKSVSKFISKLHKKYGIGSIGINFLSDYFCLQWNYWSQQRTKRQALIDWIIGDKALERWYKKNSNYQYHYRNKLFNRYDIMFNDLLELRVSGSGEEIPLISDNEEKEKLFFDGTKRLVHCIENTTLYNPKSRICIFCSQRRDCKKILINNKELKHVAILRGLYEKN